MYMLKKKSLNYLQCGHFLTNRYTIHNYLHGELWVDQGDGDRDTHLKQVVL